MAYGTGAKWGVRRVERGKWRMGRGRGVEREKGEENESLVAFGGRLTRTLTLVYGMSKLVRLIRNSCSTNLIIIIIKKRPVDFSTPTSLFCFFLYISFLLSSYLFSFYFILFIYTKYLS